MSDEVALQIGAVRFQGFTELTIESAIDNVADGFSLSGAFDPVNQAIVDATKPLGYQSCTISINDELIMTGIIDKPEFSESATENTFTIEGRSPAGQLIDCSMEGKTNFTGLKLSQIAKDQCDKFGIKVLVGLDTVETRTVIKEHIERRTIVTPTASGGRNTIGRVATTFQNVVVKETVIENTLKEAKGKPGQKVFVFLNELANRKKILLTSDPQGSLVLRQPAGTGVPVAAIIAGTSPYISGKSTFDGTACFSKYKVLHQESGSPSIVGECTDPKVTRYRPLVDTESEAEAQDITSPAKWVRAHAFAKSLTVNVTLSGWRNSEGMLWRKADMVTLQAPKIRIKNETAFIVAGVSLRMDNKGGKTTDLRLVLPSKIGRAHV